MTKLLKQEWSFMKEREKSILRKMKAYAEQIIQFKADMDFETFSKDAKTISACVFNLSQMGELAGRLEDDFYEKYPHIPWRKMMGMRNRIVHDYEGIILNIVWDAIVDSLPEFIKYIDNIE